jgi:hypothetical protein
MEISLYPAPNERLMAIVDMLSGYVAGVWMWHEHWTLLKLFVIIAHGVGSYRPNITTLLLSLLSTHPLPSHTTQPQPSSGFFFAGSMTVIPKKDWNSARHYIKQGR